jgi:hypothetical protein
MSFDLVLALTIIFLLQLMTPYIWLSTINHHACSNTYTDTDDDRTGMLPFVFDSSFGSASMHFFIQ